MIERPQAGERAILVSLDTGQPDWSDSNEEFGLLAKSAGLVQLQSFEGSLRRPHPATFAGSGKVSAIAMACQQHNASVVVFNHALTPAQERNLEQAIHCRVIDRVSLILDIFARRAKSHEGKLQVELAQLQYLSTRLVRGWTHLERQKGGIGLRGPGETQLETDRRLLGLRVKSLKAQIERVKRQRQTQRQGRVRNGALAVSLVGYTNAGKSTLFNALTNENAYAADQLFATLDTTSRRLYLPLGGYAILSDTVGFIRSLPYSLIAAFRATLEESAEANLLLHVIDVSHSDWIEQARVVDKILEEIGAGQTAKISVMNKIDVAGGMPGLERDEYGRISRIFVSAKQRLGLELIRQALSETCQMLNDKMEFVSPQ